MMLSKVMLMLTAVFVLLSEAQAANPLKPLNPDFETFADAHGVVFGDRVYLFASNDASPENKFFELWDWRVWSSDDLISWRLESVLKPEDTWIGKPFKGCWATFGVYKNNQWYWYYSAGSRQIGVATADTPAGPWKDPLGKPLIAKGDLPTEARDPDILMDTNGESYIVFGTFKYFIAKLGADMISLAEKPREVVINNPWGPYGKGKTDDKPSLHKRNGIYYLSWSSHYAISTNVYGPYEYKGSVIIPEQVAAEFKGQDLDHDRHGNFFEFNNQWYYVTNDKSQPGRTTYYRDSIMMYVHYKDNGEIAPVRIDRIGVGEYDAAQGRIEAEDYFKSVNAEKRELPAGGFEMRGLKDGSELYYPNVKNLPVNVQLTLSVACANPAGAVLEVREGSPTGELLGTCILSETGGWDSFKIVRCSLKNDSEKKDLCLVFSGNEAELCRLDWFSFSASSSEKGEGGREGSLP